MPVDRSKITRGRRVVPLKVLILGAEGVGKTTFVAGAPKVRIIDLDRGSNELEVSRVTVDKFDEVIDWIHDAVTDSSVETLAIDSISRLEELVITKVCGENDTGGLHAFGGGYGKGDDAALQYWRILLKALDRLAETKHVVLIGHATIKPFSDPLGPSFDRFSLSLREKAAAAIKRWVNFTLFARAEISTRVQEKTKKNLGITSGVRYIYTDNNPAYDAKHRGNLPTQLPLSWEAFFDAVQADRTSCEEKLAELHELLPRVTHAPTISKIKAAAKVAENDSVQLTAIIGRVRAILESQSESQSQSESKPQPTQESQAS